MSLIRRIAELLHVQKGMLLVYVLNTVILVMASYVFYGVNDILYPLFVSFFILLVYLAVTAVKLNQFTGKLSAAKSSPHIEVDDTNVKDKLIFGAINEIHEQYNGRLHQMNSSIKERNTLFSQWIHNMKVSISIIGLAAEKGTEEAISDIKEENRRLTQNLEECLNLLRLDDFARDYLPEKVNLHKVVNKAVNARKREFIYKGVYPQIDIAKHLEICTDEKWCGYMLEQVLSNAVKYSDKEGRVTVRSELAGDRVLLSIQDYGVGIDQEDLPRVFDPFFTGKNGRDYRSATGIGLYMVKHIARKLGHRVSIDSQKGAGTRVTFAFLSKV
ncbi:sensor histidine kinase [Paenibacillus riograndensis]|uniref:histidine kinase n=1 Tax=Paenibacillus riograndensis SBR5 TaxID=1073571 RepID=A0A0E4HDE0_9BACL|nr:sensor histidine kinase [Paenibacillus riograndensis]CQR58141.1 sensory transduction histidine kinase [Paenibacillus riograndensis SBR5]